MLRRLRQAIDVDWKALAFVASFILVISAAAIANVAFTRYTQAQEQRETETSVLVTGVIVDAVPGVNLFGGEDNSVRVLEFQPNGQTATKAFTCDTRAEPMCRFLRAGDRASVVLFQSGTDSEVTATSWQRS